MDISEKNVNMEAPAQEADGVFASSCLFTILRPHHHCPTGGSGIEKNWLDARIRLYRSVEICI